MPGKLGLNNAPDASAIGGSPLLLTGIAAFGTAIQLNGNQKITYDAANSTGLMNGTNAQTLAIYNTFTAGTPDYERLTFTWSSNVAIITTQGAGAGTARSLELRYGGSASVALRVTTTTTNGILLANATSSLASGSMIVVANTNTRTATSGAFNEILINPTYQDGGTNSTTTPQMLSLSPTINYTGASKTGKVVLLHLNPTNTSLPTGQSAAINLSTTASSLGGIVLNNVADEDTNYEKYIEKWSSNTLQISMAVGGTGTYRNIAWQINDPAAQSLLLTNSTSVITGAVTDGYTSGMRFTPTINAGSALTMTRLNLFDVNNPTLGGAGPAALTDMCLFRFNAAAGTHKAVDSGTTKTSPGTVTQWLKVNVNGTIAYIPSYSSKTS